MPWLVFLALRHLFPTGRGFPFFTVISILGVAIGVSVLLCVQSVMCGFGSDIEEMMTDTRAQVQVTASQPIADPGGVLSAIRSVRGVAAATPYASGAVLVELNGKFAPTQLRGVDVPTAEKALNLGAYVRVGSLDSLGGTAVIISAQTMEVLGARMGDTVRLHTVPMINQRLAGAPAEPGLGRIVGEFEIGKEQLDVPTVYCALPTAQALLQTPQAINGIDVRTSPGASEYAVAHDIGARLGEAVKVVPWEKTFDSFLWVLQLERTMMFFLLLVIIIVADFSVMSALLISVVRKTREIGLLAALGGKRPAIAACFCTQGFVVGICGTALGLVGGFLLLTWRDPLIAFIGWAVQSAPDAERFAGFTHLPAHVTAGTILAVTVSTLFISTLAGLIPALRAAKLRPADALRSD